MPASSKTWLLIGTVFGGLAVMLGAFGAHALKDIEPRQLANWETAARYQIYHGLALMVVGLLVAGRDSRLIHVGGACMVAGTIIFSGCLYLLVLTGQRWLGAVVPIGGTLMIVGWVCVAIGVGVQRAAPGL